MCLVRVKTSTWRRSRDAHEVGQQLALAVGVDQVDDLLDRLGRRDLGRDVHLTRVVEEGVRASARISASSVAAEQQVLALARGAAR